MVRDIAAIIDEFRSVYDELKEEKEHLQRELDRVKAENRYLKNYIDDLELSPTKQGSKRRKTRGISQLLTQYSEEEEEELLKQEEHHHNSHTENPSESRILHSDDFKDSLLKRSSVQFLKELSSPIKGSQVSTVILLSPTKNVAFSIVPLKRELLAIPLLAPANSIELRDEEVIEDSENEESLIIPDDFTRLQRKHLKMEHLETKFWSDSSYIINLSSNPITENAWIITDFKRNHQYKPRHLPQYKRAKIHSRNDKANVLQFYKTLNGSDPLDYDSDDEENELSQLADKWPSPPGFMVSDFPNTQEQIERQAIIDARVKDRLRRRLKLSLSQGMWLFTVDILNKYVAAKRYQTIAQ